LIEKLNSEFEHSRELSNYPKIGFPQFSPNDEIFPKILNLESENKQLFNFEEDTY